MTTAAVEQRTAPLWQLTVESFLPLDRRDRLRPWIARLPLITAVLFQLTASLRLSNSPYGDEALYINAGHDYISHWLHHVPLTASYNSYLSGTPAVYPVVAGALDSVGGLELVRLFSALCMTAALLGVWGTSRHVWGPQAGLLAAWAFAAAAPVAFVGNFGTYDAATVGVLSTAMWLGVTRRNYWTGALTGLLLALAPVLKYVGVAYIPVVLAVMVLTQTRRMWRVVLASLVAVGLLALLYRLAPADLRSGINLTTASRKAEDPQSFAWMAHYFVRDVGFLAVFAVAGAFLAARSVRSALLALCFLGGGVILALSVLRIGEGASFEKHLEFASLFFAPLAGRFLVAVSRRHLGMLLVFALLLLTSVWGLQQSRYMFEWAGVDPIRKAVAQDPIPGHYLTTSFEAMQYYTRGQPRIQWDNPYAVEAETPKDLVAAVASGTWQLVALPDGDADNAALDRNKDSVLKDVEASPRYKLVARVPTLRYSTTYWVIYRLVPKFP